jgi:corrinoid protein of di/trimethylamine methyltransferase
MDKSELFAELERAMVSLAENEIMDNTRKALDLGAKPLEIIDQGLLPGLRKIGQLFEDEEVFLPELILSAMLFQKAMEVLQPAIKKQGQVSRKKGTVVIGTVKGDMHYIGKNIVRLLLEINGFEVHDLGVDVDPLKFVLKAKEVQADIIALSALLTTTLVGQKDVIQALEGQGLRDRFKVMVGGGAVTKKWSEDIKADGYAETAYAAVEMAASFVQG